MTHWKIITLEHYHIGILSHYIGMSFTLLITGYCAFGFVYLLFRSTSIRLLTVICLPLFSLFTCFLYYPIFDLS